MGEDAGQEVQWSLGVKYTVAVIQRRFMSESINGVYRTCHRNTGERHRRLLLAPPF
jgi:hypothetical protein